MQTVFFHGNTKSRIMLGNIISGGYKTENMLARLKAWCRLAIRYARCTHTVLSTVHFAVIVIFCLHES